MRGGDTVGLRAYNERLVIDAILRSGALSKAEVARATGLSGQAASVIVNRMLAEGLLKKGDKVRGQVGQPSTPIGANRNGAFSVGLQIGRRGIDALLVDMLGAVVEERRASYDAPYPDPAIDIACSLAGDMLDRMSLRSRDRVIGIGVAIPSDLHAWSQELGLTPDQLSGWQQIDPARKLQESFGLNAAIYNDATAACAAEMILGGGTIRPNTLYIYLGTFIGAGIVIDGKLYRGGRSHGAAFASMPMCQRTEDGRPAQLIRSGSLVLLEQLFRQSGLSLADAIAGPPDSRADRLFADWMTIAVPDITRALVSTLAVIDLEAVVVDGALPGAWRQRVTDRIADEINQFDLRGIRPAKVAAGSIGPGASVRGAALLPLRERFSPDPDLLVRSRTAAQSPGPPETGAN